MSDKPSTAGKDYEVFTKNKATGAEQVVALADGTLGKREDTNQFNSFRHAVNFLRNEAKKVRTSGSMVKVMREEHPDWHTGEYGYHVSTPGAPVAEGQPPSPSMEWTLEVRPVARPTPPPKPTPPAAPATPPVAPVETTEPELAGVA